MDILNESEPHQGISGTVGDERKNLKTLFSVSLTILRNDGAVHYGKGKRVINEQKETVIHSLSNNADYYLGCTTDINITDSVKLAE